MQVQELVGIVPWTFIAQICNLFLQMYLIKRFLFKPVNEMLQKRRAMADAEIQDATKAKEEAVPSFWKYSFRCSYQWFDLCSAGAGKLQTVWIDSGYCGRCFVEDRIPGRLYSGNYVSLF